MESVLLALGGNTGDVIKTFETAFEKINANIGRILVKSSLYKTEPWGYEDQNHFFNQVICLDTSLYPHELFLEIKGIENELGRRRESENQFAPRTIDLDILFYGDKIIDTPDLVIPHPRLHLRNFVLIPTLEIAPALIHPCFKKTIEELFKASNDNLAVEKV